MATVNKDFKIKSGLVVEGTTATVNGQNILRETASDAYILNLIGGETLVKSVSNEFDVSGAGELSIDRATVDAYYDAAGDAAAAQAAAISAAALDATSKANAAQAAAEATASADATSKANAAQAAAEATASADATSKANAAQTAAELTASNALSSAVDDLEAYADQAEVDAKAYTDTRETAITTAYQSYADTAESDAKAYADQKVADLVDSAPALLDTLNELAAAIGDDPNYAANLATSVGEKVSKAGDTMTGALVLHADPVNNLEAATKAYVDAAEDSALESANIYTDNRETAITTAYESYADTAEQDAKDYADALINDGSNLSTEVWSAYKTSTEIGVAQQAAIDYADALTTDDVAEGLMNEYFTNLKAKASAADLLTGAAKTNITITGDENGLTITAENGVADSTTSDLAEGSNLYFTDARAVDALEAVVPNFTAVEVNSVAKQVASTLTAATAGIQVGHAWAKADYRSAEFLVKVAYGTHTEISKVLVTLDSSDNIAITEYGIVGTNGSASTISAGISGSDVQLLVTTANNNSTVTVMGTLLA